MDLKTQAQAISDFKEQSIEDLQAEVKNDEVEITLQKLERNEELTPQQEEYLLEESRQRHYEEKERVGEIKND